MRQRGLGIVGAVVGLCAACNSYSSANDVVASDAGGDAPAPAALDGGRDASALPVDDRGCPKGRGASMVRVDDGPASFCIDATEATGADYLAFLDSGPSPTSQAPRCAWNTSFVLPSPPDANAAVQVNHCDAVAYCAWAGKRLCGKRGGGHLETLGEWKDPAVSEWTAACSRNGSRSFAYGNAFDAGACNTAADGGVTGPKSFPGCEGGYPGIFDLSGNAVEWEDNCIPGASDAAAPNEHCEVRGAGVGFARLRSCTDGAGVGAGESYGVRCCATPAL
ncbi:MAG: SUMF1/EgtB/PvdO family nonheme iron enzyme [Labilithrix sp.]